MANWKNINKGADGFKQIGDMIKNAARNPAEYMNAAKPKKVRPKAGPAEKIGRKYGTKAGRAVDKTVTAVTRKVSNAATRIKGRAMDIAGEAKQRRYNAGDMLKAGAAGAAGYGIGQGIGSKWSEHKRQQRGY